MTETEDGIVVTDNFIAVIDGSTSKSPTRVSPDMTNGRYCMLLIGDCIRKMPSDITAEDFCNTVTAYIKRHYDNADIPRLLKHPEERLTASCITYSVTKRQLWMVGDCQCLVDGVLFDNPKPSERLLSERRAAMAQRYITDGRFTIDELRAADVARNGIFADMIATMRNQNKTYSVIDGFPIPLDYVRILQLSPYAKTVVLASDGYPFLKPTLEESEMALHKQLDTDPLNISTFKATKAFMIGNNSFDDRSYIRFEI